MKLYGVISSISGQFSGCASYFMLCYSRVTSDVFCNYPSHKLCVHIVYILFGSLCIYVHVHIHVHIHVQYRSA